jgi:hypothetical protein
VVTDDLASSISVLRTLAQAVRAIDLDAAQATEVLRLAGQGRRLLHAVTLHAQARVAATSAHSGSGNRDAAAHGAAASGIERSEAARSQKTAEQASALPVLSDAIGNGDLPERSISDIADLATKYPDAEERLVDAGRQGRVPLADEIARVRAEHEGEADRAARQHAARSLTMRTDEDGMLAGSFRLAPGPGAAVKAVLDTLAAKRWRDHRSDTVQQRAADALVDAVTGGAAPDSAAPDCAADLFGGISQPAPVVPHARVNAEVNIVVDLDALQRGHALPGERCDIPGVGPVPVAHVIELLGSHAFVSFVVRNGVDITTVARIGRHIPRDVLTALIVAGTECAIEGCHHRAFIQWDHIIEHARHGPTSFRNLQPLCVHHHGLKTSGWVLGRSIPGTRKRRLYPPGTELDHTRTPPAPHGHRPAESTSRAP